MTDHGGPRHSAPRTLTDHAGREAQDAQEARDDAEVARRAKRAIAKLRGDRAPADESGQTPPAPLLDPTALLLRRAIYVFAALIALGVIVFALLAIYTLSTGSDVAELASSGAVGANREKAAAEVLGAPGQDCNPILPDSVTFECLNRDRAALGLPPVTPIVGLAPAQLGAVLGEERAVLRQVEDERGKGAARPDVTSPPTSGRFRGAG